MLWAKAKARATTKEAGTKDGANTGTTNHLSHPGIRTITAKAAMEKSKAKARNPKSNVGTAEDTAIWAEIAGMPTSRTKEEERKAKEKGKMAKAK